jgi:hypothetical protein
MTFQEALYSFLRGSAINDSSFLVQYQISLIFPCLVDIGLSKVKHWSLET